MTLPRLAESSSHLDVRFYGREAAPPRGAWLAAPVSRSGALTPAARRMDARLGGILSAALKARPMTGAAGEVVRVFAPSGKGVAGVFLYGTTPPGQTARAQQSSNAGAKKDAKLYPKKPPPTHAEMSPALAAEKAGGALYAAMAAAKASELWLAAPGAAAALSIGEGALLRSWRFSLHTGRKASKPEPAKLRIALAGGARLNAAFRARRAVAEGVFFARALVSEPPNRLYPESFVSAAKRVLAPLGVKVSSLNETEMARLGMGALLGVAQGLGAQAAPPRDGVSWRAQRRTAGRTRRQGRVL